MTYLGLSLLLLMVIELTSNLSNRYRPVHELAIVVDCVSGEAERGLHGRELSTTSVS